jgi:hypothetical protein
MVKSIDHSLWERELAEYISLHPDLENLPPPVFPRRRHGWGGGYGFIGTCAGHAAPSEAHGHQSVTYCL